MPTRLRRAQTVAGTPAEVAILVLDDGRRCLEANLAACRMLGLSRAEALRGTLDDFIAPGMGERLAHVWHAFSDLGGYAGPFELRSPGPDGAEVHLSVTANVVPGRHFLVLSPLGAQFAGMPAEGKVQRGGPPTRSDASRGYRAGLTRREREVMALLAGGGTDEQIARKLHLSPATAQTHVRNAKKKLGAKTRAQAVALALLEGVISLAGDT
jgi:DNA-binding CsgD family transcriptional regulator